MSLRGRIAYWLDEPVPLVRIEIVRIVMPLVVLGFMWTRIAHAGHWLGDAGFRVPDLGGDRRQPLFLPALPSWAAWSVAIAMVVSGVATSLGLRTRASALVFAATLAFGALSDRLSAFSVSKLAPVLAIAVAAGPAGRFFGVDAWLERRRGGKRKKTARPSGAVRFVQLLPLVIYGASGIAKARGDWLRNPLVLFSHVHGSYQTSVAYALARVTPSWLWTALQAAVLAFEISAPLTFAFRRTRPFALAFGLVMHAMIGLMFGPVVWFALLMMTLLAAGWLPERVLAVTIRGRGPRGDPSSSPPRPGPSRRSRRARSPGAT
jgi:uncharacterized membrane protein YphA (DoxX/SURF4 family)